MNDSWKDLDVTDSQFSWNWFSRKTQAEALVVYEQLIRNGYKVRGVPRIILGQWMFEAKQL
jgi:hypothetical protein